MDFVEWGAHAHLDSTHHRAGGRFLAEFKRNLKPHFMKEVSEQVRLFVSSIFPYLRPLTFYIDYDKFAYVNVIGDYFYCYKTKRHGSDILIKNPEEIVYPTPKIINDWIKALYGETKKDDDVYSSDPYYNVALPEFKASSLFGAIIERAALGIILLNLADSSTVDSFINMLELMAVCKKYETKLKRLAECPPEYKQLNMKMIQFIYDTADCYEVLPF